MAENPKAATLFVSATTKSLKSCRIAAAEKLCQMGHTVIADPAASGHSTT